MKTLLRTWVLFGSLAVVLTVSGQSDDKALRKLQRQGEGFLRTNEYLRALPVLEAAAELDQSNPTTNGMLVECYVALNRWEAALPRLESLYQDSTQRTQPLVNYYAHALHLAGRLDDAARVYRELLQKIARPGGENRAMIPVIQKRLLEIRRAKELLARPAGELVPEHLGRGINTAFPEFSPAVWDDQTTLYFTTQRPTNYGGVDIDGVFYEDIFQSHYRPDSGWTPGEALGSTLNTRGHDACVNFWVDDTTTYLFLYRQSNNGDLLLAEKTPNGWQTPFPVGDLNSKERETSLSITQDGLHAVFVSNRPGGHGGFDLYSADYDTAQQAWTNITNLGPGINTPFNEESPALTPDGKTLYFASQGHTSMGGYDYFRSHWKNGEWNAPAQLLPPFNSTADENYLVLTKDGRAGYFASNRFGGAGGLDLYRVEFPVSEEPVLAVAPTLASKPTEQPEASEHEPAPSEPVAEVAAIREPIPAPKDTSPPSATPQPEPVPTPSVTKRDSQPLPEKTLAESTGTVRLSGTVYAVDTQESIVAELTVTDLETGTVYGRLISDIPRGAYKLDLPKGREYQLLATAEGYLPKSATINLRRIAGNFYTQDLYLAPTRQRAVGKAEAIFFAYDSDQLDKPAKKALDGIVEWLKKEPTKKMLLLGNTDNTGLPEYNTTLSLRRAEAVQNYLMAKGIDASRLRIEGRASAQPRASNATELGRAQNRRVDLVWEN